MRTRRLLKKERRPVSSSRRIPRINVVAIREDAESVSSELRVLQVLTAPASQAIPFPDSFSGAALSAASGSLSKHLFD